ncbi:MAG: transporter [Paenibacillus sp.]|jgi:iron(III) transport system ATP-binding protein|nr:transporter [Paenibacillus sp.]
MSAEIIRVTKRFGTAEVLKGIDLTIASGEFVAILGPSGCGKTTLLRLLAGFEHPTEGEIRLDGRIVDGNGRSIPPEHRHIGMVFQAFALWPHMNVREHVRFPLRHQRHNSAASPSQEQERVSQVLESVGLARLDNRMPHELSGGQKQRVAFARAVAAEPTLLLMDEPLSSLDAMLRLDMRREIQSLHRMTRASIVYVTHDQGEALAMADRIVVMNDGRIEQEGSPRDVYLRPKTNFVARFVSKANLVEGTWKSGLFYPKTAGLFTPAWEDHEVSAEMKAGGLYPVRPDQFVIQRNGSGIPGRIVNVQYQGKEIHYNVSIDENTWEVHAGLDEQFERGETVHISLKQST